MNKISILPADAYIVINKTVMNDIDRKILTMLYQPILGIIPINLYFTLWSDLDKTEIMSVDFTHHHLMNSMQLKLNDIVEARAKLEAVGLLKAYVKKGSVNNYIYQLYSPLSAAEFLTHPLLSVLLYNNIGSKEYDKIINYYKVPKINMIDFEDITIHFSELFDTKPGNNLTDISDELKKRNTNKINVEVDVDYSLIMSTLSKMLNDKCFDKSTKELINNLCFLYKIDTYHLINLIRGCINEKGLIDKLKLRSACRNYYQFENNNELPGIIYHSQPEHLKKIEKDDSKRSKMIYTFETLSPYDFLRGKYNGATPTTRDVKLVESLMVEQELNPGVVNVLIDYVLKINGNKLSKNFIETIAGQWKRNNIKTVEEAMNQAEKEYRKYQHSNNTEVSKKIVTTKEKLPDWFDKEIEETKASEEEEAKIKDMLKEFS